MRAYRARKKAEAAQDPPPARPAKLRRRAEPRPNERIAELEAEVKHLKQRLAAKVGPITKASAYMRLTPEDIEDAPRLRAMGERITSLMEQHPFGVPSPAPKSSRSSTSGRGRAG